MRSSPDPGGFILIIILLGIGLFFLTRLSSKSEEQQEREKAAKAKVETEQLAITADRDIAKYAVAELWKATQEMEEHLKKVRKSNNTALVQYNEAFASIVMQETAAKILSKIRLTRYGHVESVIGEVLPPPNFEEPKQEQIQDPKPGDPWRRFAEFFEADKVEGSDGVRT